MTRDGRHTIENSLAMISVARLRVSRGVKLADLTIRVHVYRKRRTIAVRGSSRRAVGSSRFEKTAVSTSERLTAADDWRPSSRRLGPIFPVDCWPPLTLA